MKYEVNGTAVVGIADIEFAELKTRVVFEVRKIGKPSGEQIVDGNDRVAFAQEGITQVRTKEACSTCH